MAPNTIIRIALLAAVAAAQKPVPVWSQCAGSSYAGPTACASGNYCNYGNPWYSQCVPGSPDEPLDVGVPDSPIVISTAQTIVTIGGGDSGQPASTLTTPYSFYLPSTTILASHTGGPPPTTVIAGTTYTIIRDPPVTNNKRAAASTVPVQTEAPDMEARTVSYQYEYNDNDSGRFVADEAVEGAARPTPTVAWTTIVTVRRE